MYPRRDTWPESRLRELSCTWSSSRVPKRRHFAHLSVETLLAEFALKFRHFSIPDSSSVSLNFLLSLLSRPLIYAAFIRTLVEDNVGGQCRLLFILSSLNLIYYLLNCALCVVNFIIYFKERSFYYLELFYRLSTKEVVSSSFIGVIDLSVYNFFLIFHM